MAVVMRMRWDGVTPEQYDEAKRRVGWEEDPAEGGIFHTTWFEPETMRVVDVWESPDDFQRFVDERLMPAVQEIGIEGEPQVEISEAHDHWIAPQG